MKCQRRLVVWVLTLLTAAIAPGCGPKIVKITGKLVRDGQTLQVSPDTYVTIMFRPEAQGAERSYPAKFTHATGTYEVQLPAGKYNVSVSVLPPTQKGQKNPPKPPPPGAGAKVY